MTDVIPPATLYSIHPFGQYTREQNNLWKQLFLLLDQMYLRTGGPVDDVGIGTEEAGANENQIAYLRALALQLQERIEDLEAQDPEADRQQEFNTRTATVSTTAADFDYINAKNSATITLPANPCANSVIIVRNGDSTGITINANGKKIMGSTTAKTVRKGTSLKLSYFIDSDEWLIG